jgi:hypothetical protein
MNEDIFPLDDAAISIIEEINEQIKAANIAKNAILMYFCRTHNLIGQVRIAENQRELIIQRAGENYVTTTGAGNSSGSTTSTSTASAAGD